MTIKDLKTGDIIIQRAGHIGLYMDRDGDGYGVVIYQAGGYDAMDCFNDDLTDAVNGPEFDIMQVYRVDPGMEAISFADYTEGDLIFEREPSWTRPATEA